MMGIGVILEILEMAPELILVDFLVFRYFSSIFEIINLCKVKTKILSSNVGRE